MSANTPRPAVVRPVSAQKHAQHSFDAMLSASRVRLAALAPRAARLALPCHAAAALAATSGSAAGHGLRAEASAGCHAVAPFFHEARAVRLIVVCHRIHTHITCVCVAPRMRT